MKARKLLAAAAVCAVGGAPVAMGCNALLDINAPHVVDDAGDDGSVAAEASVDAGDNVFTDPSFVNGCGQWNGDGLDVSPVTDGHTDGHACRVCSKGTTFFGINHATVRGAGVAKVNDMFYAEVWVRKDPTRKAAPDISLEIEIDIDTESNTIQQDRIPPAIVDLSETWVRIAGVFTVTAADAGDGNVVNMDILSRDSDPTGTDRCFVVDDVLFRPGSK